jgi:hypothetical protein
MTPALFFQLSDSGKISLLYTEGVFIRERNNDTYTIQLFLMDDNYYEVWQMNSTRRLLNISLVDSNNVEVLFPGICERELRKNR